MTLKQFDPRLDILPPPQKKVWPELRYIPETFTLRALSYFDDVKGLTPQMKERLQETVRAVDVDKLPSLQELEAFVLEPET